MNREFPGSISALHLACLLIVIFAARTVEAGCVMRIGEPNESADSISIDQINHSEFDALLKRYVDEHGQVCYSRWKANGGDVDRLTNYLFQLGRVDPSATASRESKLAYYINAYNAVALWGILDCYPVPSIQSLDGKKSPYDIFEDLRLWTGDGYLSLNGIENDVLRPMRDPRIHFTLVCAARGCPRLRNEAYAAGQIDWQLTDDAKEFFSRRQRFHISKLTGTVKISPILKWYREDFGRYDREVIAAVYPFLPERDRRWLATHSRWKLNYLGYDWGLNDRCPTLSVSLGRIPHSLYAQVSPLIAPLLPKSRSKQSTAVAPNFYPSPPPGGDHSVGPVDPSPRTPTPPQAIPPESPSVP